tara:strand:+ start:3252 stop:4424 length:1173 start_codon:yes stop_codon:yes gene_type:complete
MNKKEFLNLGKQPIANGFLTEGNFNSEFFYDLSVGLDEDTKLVTHMDYVKPELMFNDTYAYRGSMSKTMRDHFSETSELLRKHLSDKPRVLEIGSNDGVFLKNWDKDTTIAVEPCSNFAKETNDLGYLTYDGFWTKQLSETIVEENGWMDLIFAANCICHIPDLDQTFAAIENTLTDHGFFVFEDPSLVKMINENSYDQIYDEHPHIFSITALKTILERNGLTIVRVDNTPVHGGSNRIWVQRTMFAKPDESVENNLTHERIIGLDDPYTFERFANKVSDSKTDLVRLLSRCVDSGKKVISYGATSKSTTVFNYCGIGPDLIQYITDTTPEKQNKFSPGVHIPIVKPEGNFDNSVDFAFLGAWNFAQEIRNKESEYTGKFITHVPVVRIV